MMGFGVAWGNGQDLNKQQEEICRIFQQEGLSIKCEYNIKSVEFLDAKFDLNKENCSQFTKPNAKVEGVAVGSNNPPKVGKNIPQAVEKGLNMISSDKESFDWAKAKFQQSLKKAGHNIFRTSRNRIWKLSIMD